MTDLWTAADKAIFAAIKNDHHEFDGGWMALVPEDPPLNYSDDQDWLHFLGDIVRLYRINIPGCSCPPAARFFGLRSQSLAELRAALTENTVCP